MVLHSKTNVFNKKEWFCLVKAMFSKVCPLCTIPWCESDGYQISTSVNLLLVVPGLTTGPGGIVLHSETNMFNKKRWCCLVKHMFSKLCHPCTIPWCESCGYKFSNQCNHHMHARRSNPQEPRGLYTHIYIYIYIIQCFAILL